MDVLPKRADGVAKQIDINHQTASLRSGNSVFTQTFLSDFVGHQEELIPTIIPNICLLAK